MMRVGDLVKLATRMFRTRPARTWLTIAGIGVGIAAVVVLVGLGYGLQGILLEKIVFGDALLSLEVMTPPSRVVVIDKNEIEMMSRMDNVQDVASLASFTSLVTFNGLTSSIVLNGVEPKYFRYAGIIARDGKLFADGEPDGIVLSSAALKLFNVEVADIIGKSVNFKVFVPNTDNNEVQEVPLNKDYKVVGIIDDETSIFAYIPLEQLSSQFVVPYYDKARVKVTDRAFLDGAEQEILGMGFVVNSLSKTVDQANKIFQGVQVTLALFGGIALIVSAIGMFNTMTVTLLERTKEIGIMRTIGGSPFNIKVMFLTESVLMGFLGGLTGIAMGVGGGLSINFLLNLLARSMGGMAIGLFRFPIPFLAFIAVFSGIMGYVTGLFPSRRAGKLNPLDAIRYS